jgi:hypothetical protein
MAQAELPEDTSTPDTVKVGAYIISVHDINFHDKEYTVRFWLWFLYKNADFDFSKQLDIPNAKAIEPPDVITDSIAGKTWVIMKMKCVMKEHWNVTDFPFDKQHLNIEIENTLFDNKSLVFVADTRGSLFDMKEAIDGWTINNFKVSTGENDYETGFGDPRADKASSNFSQFRIDLDLQRNAWGLFMKIFSGMYIAFLIAAISFTPKPSELEPRFGLPVGGLFAAVGNKYIIDSLLPETSSFTLVDTLHTLTFLGIFATLVVSAVSLKLHDLGKHELSLKVNHIAAYVVVSLYVLANIVFIAHAIL